jgi:hypothetical protein
MDFKSQIIEAAYRGVLPDEAVDKMLVKIQEDICREAIRKADNTIIAMDNGLLPMEEKRIDDIAEQIREQKLHREDD